MTCPSPSKTSLPRYVGSHRGSSLKELQQAARDHNLHTLAFRNGSISLLRSSTNPIILHVKSHPANTDYDHYVLYLGAHNNRLAILDPGSEIQHLTSSQLLSRWSGAGLIVSRHSLHTAPVFARSWLSLGFVVFAIPTAALTIKTLLRRPVLNRLVRSASWRAILLQITLLFISAAFAGFLYHRIWAGGLLHPNSALPQIQQAHLPRISLTQAHALATSGGAVFIDARHEQDYQAGHIHTALNIPFNLDPTERRRRLAPVPPNTLIILYCQTYQCPFSRYLARHLLDDGYTNLRLLAGGWNDWQRRFLSSSAQQIAQNP